jgi:hypothetical protein
VALGGGFGVEVGPAIGVALPVVAAGGQQADGWPGPDEGSAAVFGDEVPFSLVMAFCAEVRVVANWRASSCSEGTWSPGRRLPARISERRVSAIS